MPILTRAALERSAVLVGGEMPPRGTLVHHGHVSTFEIVINTPFARNNPALPTEQRAYRVASEQLVSRAMEWVIDAAEGIEGNVSDWRARFDPETCIVDSLAMNIFEPDIGDRNARLHAQGYLSFFHMGEMRLRASVVLDAFIRYYWSALYPGRAPPIPPRHRDHYTISVRYSGQQPGRAPAYARRLWAWRPHVPREAIAASFVSMYLTVFRIPRPREDDDDAWARLRGMESFRMPY